MYGLTTIFHLASLIGFCLLLWQMARLQNSLGFCRKLVSTRPRVGGQVGCYWLGGVDRFFGELALALQVGVKGQGPKGPHRFDMGPWLAGHVAFQIRALQLTGSGIEVHMLEKLTREEQNSWVEILKAAQKPQISIRLVPVSNL